MPAFFVSSSENKLFFLALKFALSAPPRGQACSFRTLPHANFLASTHKVFPQQYVTCFNSGVNVTEQRGTPK
jgi:hypothetical protein